MAKGVRFTYPTDIATTLGPWREPLGDNYEQVVAALHERDRQLEDALGYATFIDRQRNYNAVMAAGATDLGAFAFMPGTPQLTFRKHYSDTSVRMDFHFTCYVTEAAGLVEAGLFDGTTTWKICQHFFNATYDHQQMSGTLDATGLANGLYTFTGLWSSSVTATTDINDWLSFSLSEVYSE